MRKGLSLLAMGLALSGGFPAMAQQVPEPSPAPAPIPQQKPNVLVWMIDDVGFAQVSSFGGLVDTPNIDRVAKMGLRYTNYHTAPICSAARASFLTGRMPHSVHIGGHATAARALPAYDARIPAAAGTIAANLHSAGYLTYALGKWDHLPGEEISPAGPFNYWATGQGFDRFYGFLAADTNNWDPNLIDGTTPIARPQRPDYHLSADLADRAITMIQGRDANATPRPFFMYWATGAAHAPHHAPPEWIARYKGKFDMGWDQARAVILKAQIAAGIVPKVTVLAPRPDSLPAWDSLTSDEKRLYARQMEVFAASLTHADAQFGRILDTLAASGQLDNTIVVITSDNGASAEGSPVGLYNEAEVTAAKPLTAADNLRLFDDWGGPKTYPHYAAGWAVAGVTPYRYYKQVAHEGGTRVPLILAWPKGIAARGELRNQFTHVSDVAPTIMDAAGVPLAAMVNNVTQSRMEGQSFKASFAATGNPRDGRAQYVELYGNKGLWWQGWQIVTTHRTRTWDWRTPATFTEPWELYDLVSDPGQTTDLAAKYPDRVTQMAGMFADQAKRYNVAPIFNLSETMGESMARSRRAYDARKGVWRYSGKIGAVPQNLMPPIASRAFTFRAAIDLPRAGVTGPVFAQGGQLGGVALYLDQGKPVFIITALNGAKTEVRGSAALAAGTSEIGLVVVKSAPGADGKSDYHVTISNGQQVLADQIVRTAIAPFFGIPDTFGVGNDEGSPVLAGYPAGVPLDGELRDVVFDFNGSAAPAPLH